MEILTQQELAVLELNLVNIFHNVINDSKKTYSVKYRYIRGVSNEYVLTTDVSKDRPTVHVRIWLDGEIEYEFDIIDNYFKEIAKYLAKAGYEPAINAERKLFIDSILAYNG